MSALSTLIRARYESWMEESDLYPTLLPDVSDVVLTTLLSHRSVRRYRDESLPIGALERMITCAQSASSSSNLQVWSVVAIEDTEHKRQAAALCANQDFIRQAPLFLVFCADLFRLTEVSESLGQPGEGLAYTEMFLLAAIDTALAAQNAAIAAEAMGLGICFVGAARNHPQELAELLHLPERTVALFGMAVGWAEPIENGQPGSAIKPRLPLNEVLHRETYSTADRPEHITAYDREMREFYDKQAMNVTGSWSTHSARRVGTAEALGERHQLRRILEERGIGIR